MLRNIATRNLTRICGILAAVSSSAIHANTTEDSYSVSKKQEKSKLAIEEVLVTATKREQSLREIPASISAFSGKDLEKQGIQGVEDIAKLVPGINFTDDPINAARVTIRGISTDTLSNPTTGVLFGDVSFTDAYIPRVTLDPNPFDMKSVEVLKGPQGTLFGASALNGAVRYVPEGPVLGILEGRWFAQRTAVNEGGADNTFGAVVNIPFGSSETAALRVMGFKRNAPGYVDDIPTGREDVNGVGQTGARAILGWQPMESLDIRLTYAWQKTESSDTPLTDNTDGELSRSFVHQESPIETEYQFADLNLSYGFSWGDLISETAFVKKGAVKYLDASRLLTPDQHSIEQHDLSDSSTFSQELRVVSAANDERWSWVVGAFYSKQELYFDLGYNLTTAPNVPLPDAGPLSFALGDAVTLLQPGGRANVLRVINDTSIVEEKAIFAEVTRRFGEDVDFTLGGRFYRTDSGGHLEQTGALVVITGTAKNDIDAAIEESGFNPKLSVLWRTNDNYSFYAAYAKGFRVGGVQPGFTASVSETQAPDSFKSDYLDSYELGLRSQFLDDSLFFDVSVFRIDWQDPQLVQNDSTASVPFIDNSADVKSEGVEAQFQWLVPFVPGLSLAVSGAYTSTVTTEEYRTSSGTDTQPGTEWPYSPNTQTATTISYGTQFYNWELDAFVRHTQLGQAFSTLDHNFKVFGYEQWDAQISVVNESLSWFPEVSLTINNIMDERGISNGSAGGVNPAAPFLEVIYIQPRNMTLRLEHAF